MTWVAPSFLANSSFAGFVSIEMRVEAPAMRQPWRTLSPTPRRSPRWRSSRARPHLGGVDGRPHPRDDAAAEEGGAHQGNVVIDLDGGVLGDDGVLTEPADGGEGHEVHPVEVEGVVPADAEGACARTGRTYPRCN